MPVRLSPEVVALLWRVLGMALLLYAGAAFLAVYRFLQVGARRLFLLLVGIEALLLVAHLAFINARPSFWSWFFNLDLEQNAGSAFSASQYLFAALLAGFSLASLPGLSRLQRFFWGAMVLVFGWLCIDEFFALHEALANWQTLYVVGGLVVVIVSAACFVLAFRERADVFVPLFFGLVVMGAGGILLDIITNDSTITIGSLTLSFRHTLGCQSPLFVALPSCEDMYRLGFIEEFFEMAGVSAVIAAFAAYVETAPAESPNKTVWSLGQGALAVALLGMVWLLWLQPTLHAALDATPVEVSYLDGDLELVGYSLSESSARPGDRAVVQLYFRANHPIEQDYYLSVHLLTPDTAQSVAQADFELGEWRYPATAWVPPFTVRNRAFLSLPAEAVTPLSYWISVRVWDFEQGTPVTIGQTDRRQLSADTIILTDLPVLSAGPVAASLQPAAYTFVDGIVLSGYDLPLAASPGDDLDVAFRWQTTAPIDLDLSQFVHLIQQDGDAVFTYDQPPFGAGRFPTTAWPPGMDEVARWQIPLPSDLPPGTYQVFTGLYTAPDVVRRPVTDGAGQPVENDAVPLGQITIAGD